MTAYSVQHIRLVKRVCSQHRAGQLPTNVCAASIVPVANKRVCSQHRANRQQATGNLASISTRTSSPQPAAYVFGQLLAALVGIFPSRLRKSSTMAFASWYWHPCSSSIAVTVDSWHFGILSNTVLFFQVLLSLHRNQSVTAALSLPSWHSSLEQWPCILALSF